MDFPRRQNQSAFYFAQFAHSQDRVEQHLVQRPMQIAVETVQDQSVVYADHRIQEPPLYLPSPSQAIAQDYQVSQLTVARDLGNLRDFLCDKASLPDLTFDLDHTMSTEPTHDLIEPSYRM